MATGPMMAIGAVDMLIPPSALTVLLGSLSGISISKLLIGGVRARAAAVASPSSPTSCVRVKLKPALAPTRALRRATAAASAASRFVLYVLPLVSIFGIVVGAMVGGLGARRPSRAAIGALRHDGARAALPRAHADEPAASRCSGTAAISAMILFIIVGATTFSQILSFSGASNGLVAG